MTLDDAYDIIENESVCNLRRARASLKMAKVKLRA
jgi:hypothetical protein